MFSEHWGSVTLTAAMASPSTDELWGFQNGGKPGRRETNEAYRCFRIFLELGPERSIKNVADVSGAKYETVKANAQRYNWSQRAAAYDEHIIRTWSQEAREEFETRHKKELEKFRRDQQKRAEKLGKVADLLIEVTTGTLEDMVASGEPVDRQQLASVASTAAKLSDAAMNTAAAALGVDDLMEAIAPEVE